MRVGGWCLDEVREDSGWMLGYLPWFHLVGRNLCMYIYKG